MANRDKETRDLIHSLDKLASTFSRTIINFDSSIGGLVAKVGEAIGAIDKSQQSFLGAGTSYTAELSKNSAAIRDLGIGGIAPLTQKLSFLQQGITSVSKESLKVATELAFTGQTTKEQIKLEKSLLLASNLSSEKVGSLISTLSETAKSHGLHTDFLLAGINSLADELGSSELLGISENMRVAIANFKADFPISSKDFDKIFRFLTSSDITAKRLAGVTEISNRLAQNLSVPDFERTLADGFRKVNESSLNLRSSVTGAQDSWFALKEVAGQMIPLDVQIAANRSVNEMRKGAKTMEKSTFSWRDSLRASQARFFGFIENILGDNYNNFVSLFHVLNTGGLVLSLGANTLALRKNTGVLLGKSKTGLLGTLGKSVLPIAAIATVAYLSYQVMKDSNKTLKDMDSSLDSMKSKEVKKRESEINRKSITSQDIERLNAQRIRAQNLLRGHKLPAAGISGNQAAIGQRVEERLLELIEAVKEGNSNTKKMSRKK